jgi:DNA polymerase/3'-5' exonuclease PolX
MSTGDRLPFRVMYPIAQRLWDYLAPVVRQHDIAGSVRRHASNPHPPPNATCGDIELVLDADREAVMDSLRAKPEQFRAIAGGPRLVTMAIHLAIRGQMVVIPVQLNFASTLESLLWGRVSNYGWKYWLATGDATWNRLVVLERKFGGLKPATVHKAESGPTGGFLHIGGMPCHTPDEQSVFDLYGIPFVPPYRRNDITVREVRVQSIGVKVL